MKYDYPFTNHLVFALVMQDEDLLRELLRRVLPELNADRIHRCDEEITTEKTVIANVDSKYVRLDVFAEGDSFWTDLEMQRANEYNIPKRSRYAHAICDVAALNSGVSYSEMKSGYVIYLCCFDPFGAGLPVYRFEMVEDNNPELHLHDESYTIVLNSRATGNVPDELRQLFDYMNKGTVTEFDGFIQKLDESVALLNEGPERRRIMTYEQEIQMARLDAEAKGLEQGLEQGTTAERERVAKVMKEEGLSDEVIAKCTGLMIEQIKEM